MKLLTEALLKFTCGVVLVGLLLFWPAGTMAFPGGWLLMGLLFVPMVIAGFVMLFCSPALLKRRLDAKEKRSAQQGIIKLAGLMFIAGFVVAGLDFRFGWSRVPLWAMIGSAVLFLAGYGRWAEVTRENAYLSRAVEVQEGQKVISTGLYGVVRHPMYMATLLMFLPMPLILGSFWGLLPFALYPFLIAVRILNEEKVLTAGLAGYEAYKQKVRYRLVPFLWEIGKKPPRLGFKYDFLTKRKAKRWKSFCAARPSAVSRPPWGGISPNVCH